MKYIYFISAGAILNAERTSIDVSVEVQAPYNMAVIHFYSV